MTTEYYLKIVIVGVDGGYNYNLASYLVDILQPKSYLIVYLIRKIYTYVLGDIQYDT